MGILVAVSLILLTAYFGESPSSPLHTLQRGIAEVFSPIQEGASKALSPVRDIAGWFSDTFQAKSQVNKLRNQVHSLQRQLDAARYAQIQNLQFQHQLGLDASNSIAAYKPVGAYVIERDPTLWYATIEVDKGSDDGVRVGDPVIGDGALVGEVTVVDSTVSDVSLITDHTVSVAALVEDGSGDTGVLVPAVGNPNQLVLQYLPRTAQIQVGQPVVTAGFKDGSLQDLFPPGIPIGQVSNADINNLDNNGTVQVSPTADLRRLSTVQILINPRNSAARAQLPSG